MEKLERKSFNKNNINNLPELPGIYIFWDKENSPLYIGKSRNLKARIRFYIGKNLPEKTKSMINKTSFFSIIKVTSELEALLLEANLIKLYQPKFNFNLKDDKNPLYIKITKEEYPQVLTARKIDLDLKTGRKLSYFGPFPSSQNVKTVLSLLRKIFPFSQHKVSKKACFYNQLGLCDPCPSVIAKTKDKKEKILSKKRYLENIKRIKEVLSGKIDKVILELDKKMEKLSKEERYEEALIIRDQIQKLRYITQTPIPAIEFIKNPNLEQDLRKQELQELKNLLSNYIKLKTLPYRIECYDVAHLSGTFPTASMVTFINAEPEKNLYRQFKIRQKRGADDIASLKEVSQRRARHFNALNTKEYWGIPDLILVDGGKAQVAVFWNEMKKYHIPVIGLAKRYETLIVPTPAPGRPIFKPISIPRGHALNLLQRIRDEAHRFARKLHHKLIQKELLKA